MSRTLPMLLAVALLLPAVGGCATTRGSSSGRPSPDVQKVLDQALMMLGDEKVRVGGRPYRADCSGYVTALFDVVSLELVVSGVDGQSGSERIFRSLQKRGRVVAGAPRPGDLAFFHDTYDRNSNGLRDDSFTHVALVESVGDDGTVGLIHFVSGRVKRDVMNHRHREVARDPDTGNSWNSFLREGSGRVLTGQLFFKFGRPLPE